MDASAEMDGGLGILMYGFGKKGRKDAALRGGRGLCVCSMIETLAGWLVSSAFPSSLV